MCFAIARAPFEVVTGSHLTLFGRKPSEAAVGAAFDGSGIGVSNMNCYRVYSSIGRHLFVEPHE